MQAFGYLSGLEVQGVHGEVVHLACFHLMFSEGTLPKLSIIPNLAVFAAG
jgi:hypothetical protein